MKILNIGMKWNTEDQRIWQPAEVRYAMEHEGWRVLHLEVQASRTEPTCVVIINDNNFTQVHADNLCRVLRQDCFAVVTVLEIFDHNDELQREDVTGIGDLVGPGADSWGTFDPEQFILPDRVAIRRAAMQLTEEIIHAQRTTYTTDEPPAAAGSERPDPEYPGSFDAAG